jgi:hypothetical protein
MISILLLDLWKLALSKITTCPDLRTGTNFFSSHSLNKEVLQVSV